MNILQVNKADVLGGSERIAALLCEGYRRHGHGSWLAVGEKFGDAPYVVEFPASGARDRALHRLKRLLDRVHPRASRSWRTERLYSYLTNPGAFGRAFFGRDSFDYPGTWKLLGSLPATPDLIHCHNLHGSYFDLRTLPWLAESAPVVVTLHDAWLISGGCTHPLECTRWKTGCGKCPHLDLYFRASMIDSTARNWRRKKSVLDRAHFHVITPSQWLMDQIPGSIVEASVISRRVIHNGVDLSVFRPGDRAARAALGLDPRAIVVMHASRNARRNASKDYATMRAAIEIAARQNAQRIVFVVVGEFGPSEAIAGGEIRFVPFLDHPRDMARHYAAADIYLQGSLADTFPNTVLEAMACGLPVVASRVGGIPEQVADGQTGRLVPVGATMEMAEAIGDLIGSAEMRCSMGASAAETVRAQFDVEHQIQKHLDYYLEILATHAAQRPARPSHAKPENV